MSDSKTSVHHWSSSPSRFLCFCSPAESFLKGRKAHHLVLAMSRIVCREFSHTTKYCKMFHIVITLGCHFQTPTTDFLFRLILISSGTCANLTLSNQNDLNKNTPPRFDQIPQKYCQERLTHINNSLKSFSLTKVIFTLSTVSVHLLTHRIEAVALFFSLFCQISQISHFLFIT